MKKSSLVIMIIMVMAGCGKDTSTSINVSNTESSVETENIISESPENTKTEEVTKREDTPEGEINSEKSALNLKEYENVFEDRDIDESGDIAIFLSNFKAAEVNTYYLTDSVDLYIDNGKCIGYTKPEVEISVISEDDEWYLINVDGNDRYAKIADVKAVGFPGTEKDYVNSQQESSEEIESAEVAVQAAETSQPASNDTDSAVSETSKQEAVPETPTVAESDKYTPEEAIAVYRSAMEAGGITWDPSLKGVTSWGTGWIYLEKGQPEWCASTDLESFAMGDSAGRSWTKYYLEVTGSDDECVYITAWHSN